MRLSRRAVCRAALLSVLAGGLTVVPTAPAHAAPILADGFATVPVATGGFVAPTASTRTPDGRLLVAEKAGRVRLVLPGQTAPQTAPLIDIRAQVNSAIDRGLLGLTVDTDFATNRWLYLLYSVELYPETPDTEQPVVSRLTRVTLNDDNTVGPETVILGKQDGDAPCPLPANDQDCIPADYRWHVIGTVLSDPRDGTLWVGNGDTHPLSLDETTFRPYQETNAAGKILHINRDGTGVVGHPYCPTETDRTKTCTKIYAKGFRNPFRFTLRPDGGLVVGDVGATAFEEVNLVEPGGNYGWPCYEGTTQNPVYKDDATCRSLYAQGPAAVQAAAYAYPHAGGASVIAGPVYDGDAYPADWAGDVLIADYTQQFIRRLDLSGDTVVGVHDVATAIGTPVDLRLNAAGEVEYVQIFNVGAGSSGVHKLTFTQGNRAPTAAISATPSAGTAPLTVAFSASGSSDPDGDPLTYSWDFGDGTPLAAGATPSHEYTADGVYTATVSVSDGQGHTASASTTVSVGDVHDPVATITSPPAGATFVAGQELILSGAASDVEDGPTLPGDALQWDIRLVHGTHEHQAATPTGTDVRFTPQIDHDSDAHYRILLTATDSSGRTHTVERVLLPDTEPITFDSVPPGAPIVYGEAGELTAPFTRSSTIGYRPSVSAAERWVDPAGQEWVFQSWSDLTPRQHDISVPSLPSRYVAHYASVGPAQTMTFTPVADTWVAAAAPTQANGTATQLRVDAGGAVPSPENAYLRFDVSSIGCRRVRSVRLRMTQVQYSPRGGQVHAVADDTWNELTTTYDTRPAHDPAVLGTFGIVTTPNTYEVALGAASVSAGLVSFALDSIEYDGARWASRETTTPPQLLVTVDPTSTVGVGAALDPLQHSGQDHVASTVGGRVLSVHSPAAGGVQLAWTDGGTGCAWSSATRGAVGTGRIAPATRGRQAPAIVVAETSSGAEAAWVVYAPPTASAGRTPLRVRRLTGLDHAGGPSVGPEVVLDAAPYGALRPDLAVETPESGNRRVAVTWVRRPSPRSYDTRTSWLSGLDGDRPTLSIGTLLLRSPDVPRPATLATTQLGVRALVVQRNGTLRLWTHSPVTPGAAWTLTPTSLGQFQFGASPTSHAVTPNPLVNPADRALLVAADTATGVRVARVASAGSGAATTELSLVGYRHPVLAGNAQRAVLVMRRISDGATVSRIRTMAGVWSSADVVELTGWSPSAPALWPAAVVAAGKLYVVVPGDRVGATRRLSGWSRAF